jgi:hypothetical protein
VKVAVFARLGEVRTRAGKVIPRLHHHRVAAVLGGICQATIRKLHRRQLEMPM